MNERGILDLIIALLPGLKPRNRIKLLKGFDCEDDFIIQSKKSIEECLKTEIKNFWNINNIRVRAQKVESVCRMRSIDRVSWKDMDYPPLLREIYDPPPVIFYRGKLPDPEKSMLGMVGTRRPSPEAAAQAFSIAQGAGKAGISVVSGLALGIDAMSHRGNLSGGAKGYAVLGSGADEIYPSSNRALAKQILDSGGAIITEYPPGTRPAKWNFPARNRIISALSRSLLIVEAPKKSGALITAAFALEQNRDLWVASSGVQARSFLHDKSGTLKLAEDGAEIVYSELDILRKWNLRVAEDDSAYNVMESSGMNIAASMAELLEIQL